MHVRILAAPIALLAVALAGCSRTGEIDASGGITAVRSVCPSVGVPAATGDVTLFDPAGGRSADAIDVNAIITNVRSTCADGGDPIVTTVTFDVLARRSRTDAAREVVLPYFSVVTQGGTVIVAKRVNRVAIRFEAGQARARATATAASYVTRASATLPDDVRRQITRERKAGDQDAALDPLADPQVRQAVARATFETLVGFQLTDEQLRYNATR
ncbi:hypothetical protein SAMN06297144_0049 [Sphingomonas guangdongensis]|uniref:Lipoprotein n=1 Tax=Sphingomonas guangdongensis TaxID=1141890 RepID=A0A285Q9J8_9SPHN|nr:hypothetical protein [Sphingomonas guangdongensis]SOB78543.1 hypothetical protein SAMN06297144_0049 [Sphingomonas guangdongensis]